jgi:hypothetical protein
MKKVNIQNIQLTSRSLLAKIALNQVKQDRHVWSSSSA